MNLFNKHILIGVLAKVGSGLGTLSLTTTEWSQKWAGLNLNGLHVYCLHHLHLQQIICKKKLSKTHIVCLTQLITDFWKNSNIKYTWVSWQCNLVKNCQVQNYQLFFGCQNTIIPLRTIQYVKFALFLQCPKKELILLKKTWQTLAVLLAYFRDYCQIYEHKSNHILVK